MTRRRLLAFLVANACLAGPAPAAAALTQVPVKATSLREEVPGTGGTYLAWSQNNAGHRFAVNLFVQNGGAAPVRVNPRRTSAWAGSIDGTTL
ncbi:MAG TPA: hypothetical protein VE777_19035, partial [Gaiellales bacterium]|nr:hypothetical protein [Gaiellales bacterium]